MAAAAINTTRLWALVAREFWRKARRRLRAGPAYRWRYSGRTPERVLIAPPDLRLADPQIALEIYYGRYPLSGRLVETGGQSPFQIEVNSPLIGDVGLGSPSSRSFIDRLAELTPAYFEVVEQSPVEDEQATKAPPRARSSKSEPLEEWL